MTNTEMPKERMAPRFGFHERDLKAGQTLIEMLVSLAVILWLAGFLAVYNRKAEEQAKLLRARQNLIFDLRRAQDYALTTREFVFGALRQAPCGYGIFLQEESAEYIIFADLSAPADTACAGANFRRTPNEDVETVRLERGARIVALNATDIVFIPSLPAVAFTPSVEEAIITLSLDQNPGLTTRIRVTRTGEISEAP